MTKSMNISLIFGDDLPVGVLEIVKYNMLTGNLSQLFIDNNQPAVNVAVKPLIEHVP